MSIDDMVPEAMFDFPILCLLSRCSSPSPVELLEGRDVSAVRKCAKAFTFLLIYMEMIVSPT